MKNFIIPFILIVLLVPSAAFSINKIERTGKIEVDENGSYSQNQRNYKERRAAQKKMKKKGGYYNGEYHSKSQDYQRGEWQFVKSSGEGEKPKGKKYKKVVVK